MHCSPIVDCGCLSDIPDLGNCGRLTQSQAALLQSAANVCQGVVDLAQDGTCAVCPGAVYISGIKNSKRIDDGAQIIDTG